MNRKGSALQIVLLVFLILNGYVLSTTKIVLENGRALQRIEIVDDSRILELEIISKCKEDRKVGNVSDAVFRINDASIQRTVLAVGEGLKISIKVEQRNVTYQFSFILNDDDTLSDFLYL